MLDANVLKKIAIGSVAAALSGFGSQAVAHTGFQNTVTEGSTTYNNVVIGHTCAVTKNGKETKVPVIAQSVVFPSVNPVLFEDSSTEPSTLTLAEILNSSTGLANVPQLIQSTDIFSKQSEKTDSNGNVTGFNGSKGNLDSSLHGLVPFRTASVTFRSSKNADPVTKAANTDSCVTKLVIKVAIADICKNTFPPKEGTANLWIPNTTAKFTEVLDGTSATTRGGSPATLTINRNTTTNPLDDSCGGTGKTVTVWPSDEDVDANLPIPGAWGK